MQVRTKKDGIISAMKVLNKKVNIPNLALGLVHPFLTEIDDVFYSNEVDKTYIIMEYVNGGMYFFLYVSLAYFFVI